MIIKEYGKFVGVCDICDETTPVKFRSWADCRDWLKENWHTRYDRKECEWQHYCENCKNLT